MSFLKDKDKILTICHDAGGAEIVSAYVKHYLSDYNFICLADGPAKKIFTRKNLKDYLIFFQKPEVLFSQLKRKDLVLTGTSWGSSMELDFIKEAKKKNIKTAVYLDHWVNYCERFKYPQKDWKNNLPDEIWVGDKYAYELAKKSFPEKPIKLVENLYFKEVKEKCRKVSQEESISKNILFMSEPARASSRAFSTKIDYDEFEVLDKLLEYFLEKGIKKEIVICYHPSEKRDKYDSLISKYQDKLKIRKQGRDVFSEMAQADLIIGMESMILVVACLCKKKVISFIPDPNRICSLPFKNIIKINNTEQLAKYVQEF